MEYLRIRDYIYYHEMNGLSYSYRFYPDNFVLYTYFYDNVRLYSVSQLLTPTQENVSIGCYKINSEKLSLVFNNKAQHARLFEDGTFSLIGEEGEEHLFKYIYVNWKENWQSFKTVLQRHGIKSLYHFTDRLNLFSIRRFGGLYSWKYCNENGIVINKPSSGDLSRRLDLRYGLQDYVRISFTKNHPMMYAALNDSRISDPVILEISPDVIFFTETIFSNMNATKNGHIKGDSIDHFNAIKFEVVTQSSHLYLEDSNKKYYQAEVLVKKHIPLSYIGKIIELDSLEDYEDESVLPF